MQIGMSGAQVAGSGSTGTSASRSSLILRSPNEHGFRTHVPSRSSSTRAALGLSTIATVETREPPTSTTGTGQDMATSGAMTSTIGAVQCRAREPSMVTYKSRESRILARRLCRPGRRGGTGRLVPSTSLRARHEAIGSRRLDSDRRPVSDGLGLAAAGTVDEVFRGPWASHRRSIDSDNDCSGIAGRETSISSQHVR